MILIDEILKQLRGIKYLAERRCFRLEKDGMGFFLEYMGRGSSGGHALRLVHRTEGSEVEMHFEDRTLSWLPYYLRDAETEIYLYRNHHVDMAAGSTLIQRACLMELSLRAHGFDRVPEECLYHPLFAGGAL